MISLIGASNSFLHSRRQVKFAGSRYEGTACAIPAGLLFVWAQA